MDRFFLVDKLSEKLGLCGEVTFIGKDGTKIIAPLSSVDVFSNPIKIDVPGTGHVKIHAHDVREIVYA